jgi:8-oxo-dGTP pyrophosphatase MutT (NUDIX family)
LDGISPAEADHRLGVSGGDPPGIAFWIAALRETFEETGILLSSDPEACRSVGTDGDSEEGRLRAALHDGRIGLADALDALGTTLAGGLLAYVGHWVTPVRERYRYDTRFFAAEVPHGCPVFPDGVELVDHLWVPPAEALRRNEAGSLPMVFPTILTLESLAAFAEPGEALREMGNRKILRLLPGVEETEEGLRMTL